MNPETSPYVVTLIVLTLYAVYAALIVLIGKFVADVYRAWAHGKQK